MEENKQKSQDNTTLAMDKNTIDSQPGIDSVAIEKLKSYQSLTGAVLGGLLGSILGAALWTVIIAVTKYQIEFLILAIGILTGFLVRILGHGLERRFGLIGAAFTFLGCLIGNILTVLVMTSYQENISFGTSLQSLDLDNLTSIIKGTFSGRGLLFYAITIIEGYKFSFVTKNDAHKRLSTMTNLYS